MEILVELVVQLGKGLYVPFKRHCGYLCFYAKNVKELEDEVELLQTQREDMNKKLDEESRSNMTPQQAVKKWKGSAVKAVEEAEILSRQMKDEQRCLMGWCPNLRWRHEVGKKASKQIDQVQKLKENGDRFLSSVTICHPRPPPDVEEIRLGDKYVSTTVMEQVMDALGDDNVRSIGIHGMGGIGKTTLVENINNRLKESRLFDKVIFVTVSQNQDMNVIQDRMGKRLGMNFDHKDSTYSRANRLLEMLKKLKSVLIILDDVWTELKVVELGLPRKNEHECCKIIVTTRNRDVCLQMGMDKVFEMKPFSYELAWALFESKVGDVLKNEKLLKVGEDIVKECGGSPLAIVTLGSTLAHEEDGYVWRDALSRLKSSEPTQLDGIISQVITSIEFSYDHLRDQGMKFCFLFCSLFPEDYEINLDDLRIFGIGEGFLHVRGNCLEAKMKVQLELCRLPFGRDGRETETSGLKLQFWLGDRIRVGFAEIIEQMVRQGTRPRFKAEWTPEFHQKFITLCEEQVLAGNRPTTHLTKAGWKNVMDGFYMRTGVRYDKKQFKNHWDHTKAEWKVWNKLIDNPDVSWDPLTEKVDATEDFWSQYLQMHPEAAQFRHKGLPLAKSLDYLFSGANALVADHKSMQKGGITSSQAQITPAKSQLGASETIVDVQMKTPCLPLSEVDPNEAGENEPKIQQIWNESSPIQKESGNKSTPSKLKANWTRELHGIFVRLCEEQVLAGNRPGTHLTKEGWKNVMDGFYKKTGLMYEKKQFKNHWDTTKEQWKTWNKLISNPEAKLDPETERVKASEEFWENYLNVHPEAALFRYKGLPHSNLLDNIFSETVKTFEAARTVEMASTPSDDTSPDLEIFPLQAIPSPVDNQMESTHDTEIQAPKHGSPSVSHSDVDVIQTSENGSQDRPRKRKAGNVSCWCRRESESPSARLDRQLTRLCDAFELRSQMPLKEPNSIKECIQILNEMADVPRGSDLYMFAVDIFLKKEYREVFIELSLPNIRVAWLRRQYTHRGGPF
ncbi:hypothetical protein H6P81_016671 [Aristolochia fimbriata]|uniref:AAA+ ATPase domain-containing protein n=1 Tax=Aristolochia fimbriata TaxID=158543 RepID=A0AAV7EBW4_ARIFI|nr:hypothetical protein H6P81_016671 [Aristolochia fimbriata]